MRGGIIPVPVEGTPPHVLLRVRRIIRLVLRSPASQAGTLYSHCHHATLCIIVSLSLLFEFLYFPLFLCLLLVLREHTVDLHEGLLAF